MAYYRVVLDLKGPLATPLNSGTLFGHLCWAYRHLSGAEGDRALTEWLRELPRDPFLISDGMPSGWLPQPLLQSGPKAAAGSENFKEIKKARRRPVTIEDFRAHRGRLTADCLPACATKGKAQAAELLHHRQAHNTINRLTSRPLEAGGLYFMDEQWPGGDGSQRWDVWVRTSWPEGLLRQAMEWIGSNGYGRDASLGRGRFGCAVETGFDDLFTFAGNRRMSLSHGTLSGNMGRPLYRIETHYGKTGSLLATSGAPHKYPVTLLRPGASFDGEGDGVFGELLENVHPTRPEIRHNGWHLTFGFREAA